MSYDPVYMRAWRKAHPNYHRDWAAAHPGYHATYAKEHPRSPEEARAYAAKHWDKDLRHSLWLSAKHRAKKLGRDFTIAESDIAMPADMQCPLLGVTMLPRSQFAPTLDRKDSLLGYVPGNVWVISKRANAIKHDSPLEGWCVAKLARERQRLAA